jgi:2-oxoisovalerate dehydrogenase E2 component (dihydrolipoyl transacylase)
VKFLEAQAKSAGKTENKMQPGTRTDQGGPGSPKKEAPTIRSDVRALADEFGVDLSTVTGTGADGTITKTDVRKAAQKRDGGNSENLSQD